MRGMRCRNLPVAPSVGSRLRWVRLLILLRCVSGLPAAEEPAELPAVGEPGENGRRTGKFIWADLFTPEPERAAIFYAALFDWQPSRLSREGHSYIVLRHQGVPTAGIVARPGSGPDARPGRWVGYVAVADLEHALTSVRAAGGRVLAPAREFPRRGTQAIVSDAEGAVIGVMHAAGGDPGDYASEVGDWIWAELFSREPARAAGFYRAAFGYETRADPQGVAGQWFLLESGSYARAAVAPLPETSSAPASWLRLVRVADVERAVTKAAALGGRVLLPPGLSHLGTRHAIVADPQGAAIGVIEFIPPAEPAGSRP